MLIAEMIEQLGKKGLYMGERRDISASCNIF